MTKPGLSPNSIFRPKPIEIAPTLLRRRKYWDALFYWMGKSSALFACLLLVGILASIVYWAIPAFLSIELKLTIPHERILNDVENPLTHRALLFETTLKNTFPDLQTPQQIRQAQNLFSLLAQKKVYYIFKHKNDFSEKDPKEVVIWVPAQKEVALFLKHLKKRPFFFSEEQEDPKKSRLTPFQRHLLTQMEKNEAIRISFNWGFFKFSDSQTPELAGIYGALIGSLYVLAIALLFSLPIGVMSAIYLEELSKDTRLNRWIEINLNNLAAVPSVVFGLLGLSVFLNFLSLPRSASLVGGLTLGLLLLPIMIVSSRLALRAVPDTIRQAARGLGASPLQVVFHHVVPLAFSGILTGTLLALARALGECASLLMVGMMAFITQEPKSIFAPATTLPIEIYQWVERPERGFDELSSAAILFLLLILGGINWTALFLKRKFEKRW